MFRVVNHFQGYLLTNGFLRMSLLRNTESCNGSNYVYYGLIEIQFLLLIYNITFKRFVLSKRERERLRECMFVICMITFCDFHVSINDCQILDGIVTL